jgi:membrane fusion protein (multidrug efflux system)
MGVDRIALRLISAAGVAASLLLAGCGQKPAAAPPPPPEVGVMTLQPRSLAVTTELPGRTSAYLVAQVRARVDGIILKRDFKEGSLVKAGQLLYQIDPAPFEATLASAKATLAKAQASLATAQAQAARFKTLVAANAVSKQDYDNAVATQGEAAADVASGKAAVQTAQINLGYTKVVSPITGRIGTSQVTEGAYVQASAATLMATVQQIDPIYINLTESTNDVLRLRREMAGGQLQLAAPNKVKVNLTLDDGSEYPQAGTFQFSDITVDQGTGSVTVRAIFPNADGELLPGMFVRARIHEGSNDQALVVPQVGITHNQKGEPTALVVGPDNKVESRTLTTVRTVGNQWQVSSGLKAGERVIVQGTMKVQPGMTVKPVEAQLKTPISGYIPTSEAQAETTAPGASSASQAQ